MNASQSWVPVKFDIDQYQIMMDKALVAGLNRSEYVRQSALHCKVVVRLKPKDVKAIRDLQGIAKTSTARLDLLELS